MRPRPGLARASCMASLSQRLLRRPNLSGGRHGGNIEGLDLLGSVANRKQTRPSLDVTPYYLTLSSNRSSH
jgi:hypothetical protein